MVARLESDNYYELLGLARHTMDKPIVAAWERLRKEFDPHCPEAQDLFEHQAELQAVVMVLREAFEVLSDPSERARYDMHLDREPRGVSFPLRRDMESQAEPAVAQESLSERRRRSRASRHLAALKGGRPRSQPKLHEPEAKDSLAAAGLRRTLADMPGAKAARERRSAIDNLPRNVFLDL